MDWPFEEKLEVIRKIMNPASPRVLVDQKVEVTLGQRYSSSEVLFRITGHLWGEYLDPIIINHPADWWQLFKEHNFPLWAIKISPIQYRKEFIMPKVIYPQLTEALGMKLEKLEPVAVHSFPREMLDDMNLADVETWAQSEYLDIIKQFQSFVGGKDQTEIYFSYYANGWQALKERWFTPQMKNRWPVKYSRHVILAAEDIDSAQLSLPEKEHYLVLSRA